MLNFIHTNFNHIVHGQDLINCYRVLLVQNSSYFVNNITNANMEIKRLNQYIIIYTQCQSIF